MLTYALIGLGGAIGSLLRAWIGVLMVALTGPAFPWGTILINILGSALIGFFGTLTATDGRFAVPSEARAFVMVGVCGGFTTFSSFSLQTFDLARDGRPGQALANVALSILLCVGGVAAGHSAALLLRMSGPVRLAPVRLGAAGSGSLGDTSLIALHRPESVQVMLDVAARLMAREHDRMTALAIDGPVLADLQPTEEVLTTERREAMSDRRRGWVEAMRPTLDQWVRTERADGHRARWIEIKGDGTRAILEHGRQAHLLLLEHRPDDPAGLARIRTALLHASRPVLLVPLRENGEIGRIVAVAWRDDAHARQAVRAAMPILSRAERVIVLHVGGSGRSDAVPPDVFGTLVVEARTVPDAGIGVGEQILTVAHAARADLLVMARYDHHHDRAPEALFDGVTEAILRAATLPVLMHPKDA